MSTALRRFILAGGTLPSAAGMRALPARRA